MKRKLSKVKREEIAVACDYAKERHGEWVGKITWRNGAYLLYDNEQVRELRKYLPHRLFTCSAFFIRYQGQCTLFPHEMLDTVLNFLNVYLESRGIASPYFKKHSHFKPAPAPTSQAS
jgi:hypothetical protein